MRRRPSLSGALALAVLANACTANIPSPQSRYLDTLQRADRDGVTFPAATQAIPGLDLTSAYAVQHRLIARKTAAGDRIAGFKSGLMSAKSLADRKAKEPLVGVLFASGAAADGDTIRTCGYRRPALEMKIGFVIAKEIRQRIPSVETLKRYVGKIQPVAELPDIAYADDKHYVALDMVAANISSARFVQGQPLAIPTEDLDAVTVTVARGGTLLTHGAGGESLGGQWPSLLAAVNLITSHGYRIAPGQIVLTGKIGDKLDLRPGLYHANYGPLGALDFAIADCKTPD